MSVTPISMTQVQGVLQNAKRRTGAASSVEATQHSGFNRFEELLREPQQVADAMASTQSSQTQALLPQAMYFGLSGVEQDSRAGMNLRNISTLATLINVSSVESSVLGNALKSLTDAAEKNQLETALAAGVAPRLEGMMSREIVTGNQQAVLGADSTNTGNGSM